MAPEYFKPAHNTSTKEGCFKNRNFYSPTQKSTMDALKTNYLKLKIPGQLYFGVNSPC
jgi:hypothetical protein